MEDIESVYRAGKPPTNGEVKIRPLIVTLKTPQMTADLHIYGRGRRVPNPNNEEHVLWINADLIAADREAQFKARQEFKERRSHRPFTAVRAESVSSDGRG